MSQFASPTAPESTQVDPKEKKPIYKRKWFLVLAGLMIIGYFAPDSSETESDGSKTATSSILATTTLPETVWSDNLKIGVIASDLALTRCTELAKILTEQTKLFDARMITTEKPYEDPYSVTEYFQTIEWETVVHTDIALTLKRSATDSALTEGSISIPLESQYIGFVKDSEAACGLSQNAEALNSSAFKLDQRLLNMKSAANNLPWYPEGFNEYKGDSQIAYRWLTYGSEYSCSYSGSYCFGMYVIARNGCPTSVYVELNLLDGSDTNLGYTNDTTAALAPGQKAKLVFDTFADGVESANLAEISCY